MAAHKKAARVGGRAPLKLGLGRGSPRGAGRGIGRAASGKRRLSRFGLVVGRGVDHFRLGLRGGGDLDLAWLQNFRKLAHQLYGQQTVFKLRGPDADVIGKAEAAFEIALGDAAMEELAGPFAGSCARRKPSESSA